VCSSWPMAADRREGADIERALRSAIQSGVSLSELIHGGRWSPLRRSFTGDERKTDGRRKPAVVVYTMLRPAAQRCVRPAAIKMQMRLDRSASCAV